MGAQIVHMDLDAATSSTQPDARPTPTSGPASRGDSAAVVGNGSPSNAAVGGLPKVGVFLLGKESVFGSEPWFTDGTADGTRMLVDINPGQADSYAYMFGVASGRLVLAANTEGGVKRFLAISPADNKLVELVPEEVFRKGGDSYFQGCYTNDGRIVVRAGWLLWITDGTPQGTKQIGDGKVDALAIREVG